MKLTPKNWIEFQHYKDRSPPWIKLHKGLLDDYEYQRLPVASRALAPMLWLLASEVLTGEFDASPVRVAFRLRMPESEYTLALKPLIDAGFFLCNDDASALIADCKRDAMPEERRGETEREADIEPTALVNVLTLTAPKNPRIDCPMQVIADRWMSVVVSLPAIKRVDEWPESRKSLLRSRWIDKLKLRKYTTTDEGVEYWARLFQFIEDSDFLAGRDGEWKASFDWVMNKTNLHKIIEGNYVNKVKAGSIN